jgi:hypothetical protein
MGQYAKVGIYPFQPQCFKLLSSFSSPFDAGGPYFFHGTTAHHGPGPPLCRVLKITTHTTLDRAPLDERSARRRDLYLTTNNSQKRRTSKPAEGIRTCNTSKWAAVDVSVRATTGIVTMHLNNKLQLNGFTTRMPTHCNVTPETYTSTRGLRTCNFNYLEPQNALCQQLIYFTLISHPEKNFLVKYHDKFYLPVGLSSEMSVITLGVSVFWFLVLKNRAHSQTVCKPPIKHTVNYASSYKLHTSVTKPRYIPIPQWLIRKYWNYRDTIYLFRDWRTVETAEIIIKISWGSA